MIDLIFDLCRSADEVQMLASLIFCRWASLLARRVRSVVRFFVEVIISYFDGFYFFIFLRVLIFVLLCFLFFFTNALLFVKNVLKLVLKYRVHADD